MKVPTVAEETNNTTTPAFSDIPAAKSKTPLFDPANCGFLTEVQIEQVLGNQITDVIVEDANFVSKSSLNSSTSPLRFQPLRS